MEFPRRRPFGMAWRLSTTVWWLSWTSLLATTSGMTEAGTTIYPSSNITSTNGSSTQSPPIIKPTVVTSGRKWDLNDTSLASPPRISTVITAQSGDTAFLPCHVTLREEHGVSWVRRRDWYILTAESKVYSRDERVRVTFNESPDSTWTLLIKYIRKDDEGIYDCQITTRRGAWTQSVELRIVEPQAVLVGAEDVYVGVGSPFTITCVITNTLKPPEYVLWNVDSKPLNFGSMEQSHQLHTPQNAKITNGGGYAITFDPGPPSVSRLSVHSASASDSGRYTCQPSSGLSASTQVHVALGNEMAAIQAADAAGKDSCLRWLLLTVSITTSILLNLFC